MYKLYICAAIFLLLSVVKFLAPDHREEIRAYVVNIIDTDDNYPQIVKALGKRISQEGLGEDLIKVFNDFEEKVQKN